MKKNDGQTKGNVAIGIAILGAICVLIVLIKAFFIGYYPSDLPWMFILGIIGLVVFVIGGKMLGTDKPGTEESKSDKTKK